MTTIKPTDYGTLKDDATLIMQRTLPGPIERVWDYLTQSHLRAKWLAAGDMEMKIGTPFTLTWRNDELTTSPGKRPEGFSAEHRMESKITALDAPHKLSFSWDGSGDVTVELMPQDGGNVLLKLTHSRLPTRGTMLGVSAGWHVHLDLLGIRLRDEPDSLPFWQTWQALREQYDQRIPA